MNNVNLRDVSYAQLLTDYVLKGKEMSEFEKVVHKSGASSSGNLPPYDLITIELLDRLAKRLQLGAEKHGRFNWKKGAGEKDYILERLNHAFLHLKKAMDQIENGTPIDDDDLAGVVCNVMFAMEYQKIHRYANSTIKFSEAEYQQSQKSSSRTE